MNNIIKERIFALHGFKFAGNITEKENAGGLYVSYDGKDAIIGFANKAQEARCYFILGSKIKKGEKSFEIKENPAFDECGAMLDMSRGGVMNVEGVKKYITYMASLGMNTLLLYIEDIYELEDYPIFGYLRGRYSDQELKEIDDFAYELGVEVIPNIQGLGHLEQFLRWKNVTKNAMGINFADTNNVLLVDCDETYKFLEASIKKMKSIFRTNRIHLGMDETYGLGSGAYFHKYGYTDRTELFLKHLEKLMGIVKKYFDQPMIYSDMLFRDENDREYVPGVQASKRVLDLLPNGVNLVFWDYYHNDYDFYNTNIKSHMVLDNKICFMGAVWTWDGFVPNFHWTHQTMIPAMRACLDNGMKSVFVSKWTEDGVEADLIRAVPGLTVFSEHCYKGKSCTEADIYEMREAIYGIDRELSDALSEFYLGLMGSSRIGKGLFYADPLYNLLHFDLDYDDAIARFKNSLEVINKNKDFQDREFYAVLFEIIIAKAETLKNLRPAYQNGDKSYIKDLAEKKIPELSLLYDRFYEIFKSNWNKRYKAFGIEAHALHFGGIKQRLEDISEILLSYVSGEKDTIEELDHPYVEGIDKRWRKAIDYMLTYQPMM